MNPGTVAHIQLRLAGKLDLPDRVTLGAYPDPRLGDKQNDRRFRQMHTLWDVPVLPIGNREGGAKDQPKAVQTPAGLPLSYTYDTEGRLAEVRCGDASRWQYRYDRDGRLVSLTQSPIQN
jgi:YD repeat-containing protein